MPATVTHLQSVWRCFQARPRDFIVPILANDKDFKWTEHFILLSTALTKIWLAEERETKSVCIIDSRGTLSTICSQPLSPPPSAALSAPHPHPTSVSPPPPVLVQEPETPVFLQIHIWKVTFNAAVGNTGELLILRDIVCSCPVPKIIYSSNFHSKTKCNAAVLLLYNVGGEG